VAAGKSGDEGVGHQASSRSLTTTVVVAVIVGVLLASPLVTGYVWWFKSHRPYTDQCFISDIVLFID